MFKPSLIALTFALGASPALAAPRVVADIPPVHGLVAQVMDGIATPDLLIPAGASPHDYALKPSNAGALEAADLVIWIGEGLTPGLEKPMETLAVGAQKLTLLSLQATTVYEMRETVALRGHDDHDHAHEHAHDDKHNEAHGHDDHGEAHDHGHEAHAHEGTDPHAWLAPENGKAWLTAIAEALAEIDPGNAAAYRTNAATGQAAIDDAVAEITAQLAPYTGAPYVVFHDAYQYFERPFGLSPVGAISLSDATDPSPARIAELRDIVADAGATCVFSEPQFNAGLINAVFDGSTARTAVIDPLGTTIEPGPAFYPALLRDLARAISGCL